MLVFTKERRGSVLNKFIDRWMGGLLLLALVPFTRIKFAISKNKNIEKIPLVVCFGAIGDLIVLTEAVRALNESKKLVLACSNLNRGAASLFEGVYKAIETVDLHIPTSLMKICHNHQITTILDTTQWANVGPVQVGIAKVFNSDLETVGFKTQTVFRNMVYDKTVEHKREIHEFLNFINILKSREIYSSNEALNSLLPRLYLDSKRNPSGKLLFHIWPSGNRSYLKSWPQKSWSQLIDFCVSQGYTIYLSGSQADRKQTLELANSFNSEQVISLAGQCSLLELFSFITREIEFVVSVNTGILHLAGAAGVPVIGLHGGVNPERWGPLGKQSISLLPASGKSAYLHYGFEYPLDDDEAYVMDQLSVGQVLDAIDALREIRT